MARAALKSAKHSTPALGPSESPWRFLTTTAFVVMLALVVVRATMSESVRTDFTAVPNTVAAPAIPGPATGLLLDLLFCIPAFLVVTRRLVDLSFSIRCDRSHLIMVALGVWTLLSVLWASDKFVAAVSAAHWVAGLAMLWAASQLVVTWIRMRIVAGVCFGLLLVLLVQGYYYRFIDLPDLRHEMEKDRAALLGQRGTQEHSFEETQILKNIESGEVMGFSISRNTYAALLVLLGFVAAGAAIQRRADSDPPGWIAPIALALAAALVMLYLFVQSKTAYATPFIGAFLLYLVGRRRQFIAEHARQMYYGAVALFVLGVLAVVGHGLYHHSLVQASLTVRWQYWVGAARLFAHHPWLGVGWANFGDAYLPFRLPTAVEYPKDPHNFAIRAFVELGVVGGLLTLAWMAELWWDLTQGQIVAPPPLKVTDDRAEHRKGMIFLIAFPILSIAASALIAIDWSQRSEWIILELFKRGMFALAMLAGLGIVCLKSLKDQRLDDRPAPWIHWATLVALGLFLVHNLIDFSISEPGPMSLFAVLTGAALGLRTKRPPRNRARTPIVLAVFVVAGAGWIVAAAAGAWNVGNAEGLAQDAAALVRTNNAPAAVAKLLQASRLVPINPDYPYQAALLPSKNSAVTSDMLAKAIAADPSSPRYRRTLAQFEVTEKQTDLALKDYAAAVGLDPNNMNLRVEYADLLAQTHHRADARAQYQAALDLNAQLPASEPQRLSAEKVRQINAALKAL